MKTVVFIFYLKTVYIKLYFPTGILNENENLNKRLLMQEEDFRVQNQTLLLEITNLTSENQELRY